MTLRVTNGISREDLAFVFVLNVDGGFFGARGAAVDPDVMRDEVLLVVRMGPLVVCDQAAGPGLRLVVPPQVVGAAVLVVVVLAAAGIRVRVRLLLGEQLVERLAFLLLLGRCAEALAGRPLVGRRDALV